MEQQKLPTTRQKKPTRKARTTPSKPRAPRKATSRDLTQAFAAFTQVAGSLESSYSVLREEAARLREELANKNQENDRMRTQLVRILENLPCGVVVIDAEGAVRIANPQARDLLDLSAECLSALRQVTEGGEQEVPIGNRQLGVTCTFREGFAIYLLREVSQMALLLANEIRNPLSSLELFAGLLADSVEAHPETRQWVDHLQAGLRQVSATVHNALHHHSLPALRLAPTNLTRLLRETAEFLRPVARQKGMRLELSLDAGALNVAAEAHTLQQGFFNLALNAFRAMSTGGVLTISTRRENQTALVSFVDQGSGVPAENLARIFEAGFSSNHGSPGLGLAVCQKIVAQHGGDISVISTVGQGSEFRIVLHASHLETQSERMAA
jgi:signal transduction histidine kinase